MALESIYRYLAESLTPEELLDSLTKAIATTFEADFVYFKIALTTDVAISSLWTQGAPFDETLLTAEPTESQIYKTLKNTPHAHLAQYNIQAIAILPIPHQGTGRGWLWVGTASTLPSKKKIQGVLPPLSLTLEMLTLQQQDRRHQRQTQLLADINQLIDAEQNTNKLLQRAIAAVSNCLKADQGIIGLLKYENPLQSRTDQTTCPIANLSVINKVESLPNQWMLQEYDVTRRAWLAAPDIWSVDNLDETFDINPLTSSFKSFLAAPLMGQRSSDSHGNTVLGLLIWAQRSPRFWQTHEQQLVQFVAHQLSTAMIHRQSLRQVQSLVEERTAQLKWSLDVQAKLGAKMRQQIQQLRQLNVLKDEFLSTMSHELNTPLATMKMAVKMLNQPGRSPEKQAVYLDILDKELIRESKLINDLLKLQHFESEQFSLKPQRLALDPMLKNVREEFNNRWNFLKGISLEINYSPENIAKKLQIETDEESLTNTLSELLVNAGKYSDHNTIVQLEVEYFAKSPAQIQMRLSNDGSGIAEDEQEHIFEKFRRGSGVTDQAIPGTGLGLALVKALVEQLEGSIEVSSVPNEGKESYHTCFTLTFPQSMVGLFKS
ncbi:MAG: GAF domain-containing sensor histidine kinase [Limnothrix sp. RL_2_0]|nr:GAF domain-containing sensor histidine kinase [Limnothrix sp. RL_2_0]